MQLDLLFITRHKPTNGQLATAREIGFSSIVTKSIEFGDNPVEQLKEAGVYPGNIVAVVAPLYVSLILLRAGYILVDFVNETSARQKGVFVCKGAWVHSIDSSRFVPCPISLELQEQSPLI